MNRADLKVGELDALARRIRVQVVKMIAGSGIGHVGGSMSIVGLAAASSVGG